MSVAVFLWLEKYMLLQLWPYISLFIVTRLIYNVLLLGQYHKKTLQGRILLQQPEFVSCLCVCHGNDH